MPPAPPPDWQAQNLQDIARRLRWLRDEPEGLICFRRTPQSCAAVFKLDRQIHLYLLAPDADPASLQLNTIMSRIDLENPLRLLSLYAQAMMLSLAWQPEPERLCLLGFGGGRIAMVFHHFFPQLILECAEVDPEVLDLAKIYFGVKLDHRLRVAVRDGREFLADQPAAHYDVILSDCFSNIDGEPSHLATAGFYNLCKDRLKPGGIVAVNFLATDPKLEEKVWTCAHAFANVWYFSRDGSLVLFGNDAPQFDKSGLVSRIQELENRHRFPFPFSDQVEALQRLDPAELSGPSRFMPLLVDDEVSRSAVQDTAAAADYFKRVGRNDRCPCGSGKKFKKCHGR